MTTALGTPCYRIMDAAHTRRLWPDTIRPQDSIQDSILPHECVAREVFDGASADILARRSHVCAIHADDRLESGADPGSTCQARRPVETEDLSISGRKYVREIRGGQHSDMHTDKFLGLQPSGWRCNEPSGSPDRNRSGNHAIPSGYGCPDPACNPAQ